MFLISHNYLFTPQVLTHRQPLQSRFKSGEQTSIVLIKVKHGNVKHLLGPTNQVKIFIYSIGCHFTVTSH